VGVELLHIDCMEKRKSGWQKGSNPYHQWKGKKHKPETIEKMRAARLKNNPMHKPDVVAKRSATLKQNGTFANENSNNWKGGKTKKSVIIRNSKEYKKWRTDVFIRDNYTCQDCGDKSCKGNTVYLEAHHIKPFAVYPELIFAVSNGQTLCKGCHSFKPKGNKVYEC